MTQRAHLCYKADMNGNGHADAEQFRVNTEAEDDRRGAPSPVAVRGDGLPPCEVRQGTAEDVIAFWPFIREGCLVIKKSLGSGIYATTPSGSWQPGHVRAALLSGAAELWLALRDGAPRGFAVTQLMTDQFSGITNTCFVWLGYKHPSEKSDAYHRTALFIEDVMRKRGIEYMEGMTRNVDLPGKTMGIGWVPSMIVVRKALFPSEGE